MTDDMKQRIIDAAKRAVERSHEDPDCIDRTEVETIVLSGLLRLIEKQEPLVHENSYGWKSETK